MMAEIEMACKKCGEELPTDISATYLKRHICRECYNKYRLVNMDNSQCRVCFEPLSPENVYPSQGYICKNCYRASHKRPGRPLGSRDRVKRRLSQKTKLEEPASEAVSEEPQYEITETFVPQKKDDLYVMQNSRIPDEKKVGRSHDPEQRARQLGASQNFRLQILKVYPACGHLESTVHKRLKARKVTEGQGEEWFRVDLATLDMIVQGCIAESQIQ